MLKKVQLSNKGMQRDFSVSKANTEYAYENKNVRIMATNGNTTLSITNEKGNKEIFFDNFNYFIGIPIGQAVLNNEFVLFTTSDSESDISYGIPDRIYKINFEDTPTAILLFSGNLNLSTENPIETLVYLENENIKKVYWIDGINQSRFINIAETDTSKWTNTSFDFVRDLKFEESISIEKNIITGGIFASGVIQYSFSYFNKYGQESNIFYTSPLYYISYSNRGASAEDSVGNSFTITIKYFDTSFDYIRIYSTHRSSIDSTTTATKVVDIPIYNSDTTQLVYVDNGTTGESIDPTQLLYIGGEVASFKTFAQKDNTLFLGNTSLKRHIISEDIKDFFKNKNITFDLTIQNFINKSLPSVTPAGFYAYNSQLNYNSQQIKHFKFLETYRFGVQFQHKSGKWSDVVWVNDQRNTSAVLGPYLTQDDIYFPIAGYNLDDEDIINSLISDGYVNARPVIVYPTITDRECICQGILCPTVFNVGDRYGNIPFVQSSWFARPNAPFNVDTENDYVDRDTGSSNSSNSRSAIMDNDSNISNGAWLEFRHNYPIPSNNKRNAEIQCIYDPPMSPTLSTTDFDENVAYWVSKNVENFYIDQSIVTLHSPDIEFDTNLQNLESTDLKLRIIGVVPITAFSGDIDIQTSTPVNFFNNSTDLPIGFYNENINAANVSRYGFKTLASGAFWIDELSNNKSTSINQSRLSTGFVVYPFHRNGSLNNDAGNSEGYKSAKLDTKKISNLKYSFNTKYFFNSQIWEAYEDGSSTNTGISGVSIFNSEEVKLLKIPEPANSSLGDLNYYGNIDKIITYPSFGDKEDGYPIITTGEQSNQDTTANAHNLFTRSYTELTDTYTDDITGFDPVSMVYNSTSHAVLALNYTTSGTQVILPTLRDGESSISTWDLNLITPNYTRDDVGFFWNSAGYNLYQDVISYSFSNYTDTYNNSIGPEYGWFWLGELYNDNVVNRFGGQTTEAFENNTWIPCGDVVSLLDNGEAVSSLIIQWTEGDTYYQRYDHLKTYGNSLELQNSITDIVSFMCETHVNLDGRYDRNRGQVSNLVMTPTNFNLLNNVYSQTNNFFTYQYLNYDSFNIDDFSNSLTWTSVKVPGEDVDNWTSVTLASTLDLDGDKGELRALRRFNNELMAFQDTGISTILYNSSTPVATTEGVPIELSNSGSVEGKRYISDKIGCINKWSICETPKALYFIDDTSKSIFAYTGTYNNLSDNLGFHSWINEYSTCAEWNPSSFNNCITYYDRVNSDVLFIFEDTCLAFSETLGQFSSFYSYEKTPYIFNMLGKLYSVNLKNSTGYYKIWEHFAGDYNSFFGTFNPFHVINIANPDSTTDKIFNNLEFRSDSWNSDGDLLNTTFDKLYTWNEYQSGESTLQMTAGIPSTLKKKFRIWRANIPRDSVYKTDRMRNPWLYIKLAKESENTNKTILHDLVVNYFE